MIHIERTGDPPPILDTPFQSGDNKDKTELAVVLEAFAEHQAAVAAGTMTKRFSFGFGRYKHTKVVAELARLFNGKCAYCETRYSANQPMDVEHFRPKGAVDGDPDHPGYYWLAASWANLLPSCIDCNRQRGQRDLKLDADLNLGKETQFPVNGARAAQPAATPDDEVAQLAAEHTLLINPVDDDPADVFDYQLDESEGFVVARAGGDVARADASIKVYGLNRAGLVTERREVIRWFDHRISIIERLTTLRGRIRDLEPAIGQPDADDLVRMIDEIISDEVEALIDMTEPDRQYAALARALLRAAGPALDAAGHPR